MNRDDVIRMAREAEIIDFRDEADDPHVAQMVDFLMRFAALVAAAERDACAIACEVHAASVINDGKHPAWAIAKECAEAIRARGRQ